MYAEAEINFQCHECGQKLSADAATAGAATQCPSCSAPLVVPVPLSGDQQFHATSHPEVAHSASYSDAESSLGNSGNDELLESRRIQEELHNQLAVLHAENEGVSKQLELARQSIRESAQRSQLLEKEKAALKAEIDRLTGELHAFNDALTQSNSGNDALAAELQSTRADLEASLASVDALEAQVARVHSELQDVRTDLVVARKDIESSKDSTEFVRLKAETEAAVKEKVIAEASEAAIRSENEAAQMNLQRLTQQLKEMTDRCVAAEKKVGKLSDSELQKDNVVLRSILERQKGELEQRFNELKKFRRARFGVRVAYSIVALAAIAAIAYAMQFIPALVK